MSSDYVYVTDNGNPDNGIQKFTDNGTYITGWGTVGLQPGAFINPSGIGIDSSGNVCK